MFACLHTIDLFMGICMLLVFLEAVKLFESPKALSKFPMIIIIIIIIIIPHIAPLLCVPPVQCSL